MQKMLILPAHNERRICDAKRWERIKFARSLKKIPYCFHLLFPSKHVCITPKHKLALVSEAVFLRSIADRTLAFS